jgi:Transcriptional regulator, AbiEi antitoxin
MDPSWTRVADIARARHGTVTCAEAAASGVPPYRLARWQRSGRLDHPAPDIYVVRGAPGGWHQRVRVATGSGHAWASHRTAAALWQLDGFPPRTIEVVTPRGRRRARTGWTAHETRTLRGVDLAEVDGIACTALVRTILDLPSVAHPHLVARALDDAGRRDRGLLDAIVRRHLELPRRGRRGAALITAMLDERLGSGRFADSGFEQAAVRLVRSAGLPEPVLQFAVRDGDFVAYLDLAWPEIRWLVECDSLAHHSGKRPHEWDRARRRRLKRLGWDGVEVTYDDVTKRAGATGRELRELYEARLATVRQSGDEWRAREVSAV